MKVLYDYQAFTYQDWGGVSKCFCELMAHQPQGIDYDIAISESNNVHLKELGAVKDILPISRTLQSFCQNHSILGREKLYRFLGNTKLLHTAEEANKAESIKKLKKGDFDIFHPTFFDDYFLPYLNGKPFVLTVHDLMPELFGWWKGDPQIANKPILLEKAAAVIAVSENTKKDLCRIYNVPEDKVYVVYHGHPEDSIDKGLKDIIGGPYFLYVGRRDGYKNAVQTIRDFGEFHKKHKEVKFVFTGAGFTKEETALLKECGINDSTIHVFANEQQMASLYMNAIAFVYPSLYEGFGMPILEAFHYDCPVLLNKRSCFPEIGGNAALYFNSEEGGSNLCEKLEKMMSLSNYQRAEIIAKGHERAMMFSWEKSAEQLCKIYKRMI